MWVLLRIVKSIFHEPAKLLVVILWVLERAGTTVFSIPSHCLSHEARLGHCKRLSLGLLLVLLLKIRVLVMVHRVLA